jgi:hypothetical protein
LQASRSPLKRHPSCIRAEVRASSQKPNEASILQEVEWSIGVAISTESTS